MKPKKKLFGLPKLKPIIGASSTFHGKINGNPCIVQGSEFNFPETVGESLALLKKAGILVPTHEVSGNSNIYSRLGSKKKAFNKNSLLMYLKRYFAACENGQKPPTQQINKILDSAARAVGIMQSFGIIHNHPHFDNFVVKKLRVGVVDFKRLYKTDINWKDTQDIITKTSSDFLQMFSSWNRLLVFFHSTPQLKRSILRRRSRFVEKIIAEYPINMEQRMQLKKYYETFFREKFRKGTSR